ncbi:putative acriflavine resistance protein B [Phascolarctobacterium succinatutens CAG:287]|uniref:Putative acriflavine resistance protein B n=1 Tax=Phascolarctobacterium succinatutens CAG:287 TaxID=1263101 RepID=R6WWI2_9FIRM|nr:efflux RND transporter permease subunit [Phascolarctobacterium succinatutens]CDD11299.1 putative acriflavine resistance protein B [Phascolarctobacterium succinatutens CAG:287]
MARFFIDRPVFAIVLAIIITLLGTIAGFSLPIAQYPNITKPRISVNTNYVGASADIVEKAVAQTIEQKVSGVENMLNMSSVSTSSGEYKLNVEFNLEKNADIASVEVQNRVSQATSSLPSEVSGYGVTTAKESAETIMYFGLYSPKNTYDAMFLRTYADANFLDAVKRVKGVSTVGEYGPEYAVRIWLNPEKMAQLGVTVTDVSNAIKTQNVQAAVGSIGNRPTVDKQERTYSASAQGRLNTPEEFGNVIIRSNNGDNLKLKDIATIKEGPRNDLITSKLNGGDSVVFPVSLTSDANAIETVKNIREVLKDAESRFPDDMKLVVIQDNTQFITESLEKVAHTFVEALILVILVVFMFLGSWRATLIPILAVPVSLVGTFASFVILGFTINTLTAFAMILAIGLVVDDAIVVVEAVEHHIQENGMSPKEATYRAMNEVSGPVVAIAFVLSAVFIPVAFTGGTVGELYKQFAITISVSMMLSAIVALSLTPALCSLILVKKEEAPKGFIGKAVKAFDDWFARTLAKYVKNVEGCIRKSKLILTCLVVVVICIGFLAKATPTGFVPNEDQGMTAVSIALPEGASSNRTQQIMAGLAQNMRKLPGVKNVMEVSGIDILSMGQKANAGLAVVTMEDYSKRSNSVQDVIPMIFGMGAKIPDATVMAFQPPSLPGASSTGTLSLYLMNLGGEDVNTMGERANEFLAACRKRPEIGMLYTTLNTNTPMYQFEVDRDKAQSLNVPVSTVYSALQAFLGGNEINDINNFGRTWKVVMQADEKYRTGVEDMRYFFVRSNDGKSIPLNTLVKPTPKNSSVVMTRFNGASAIKISGDPASGYSSGQAMAAIEEVAKQVLPNTYTYEWTGQSLDEIEAGSRSTQIFIISLIFVFLCLAALYESWTIPLAVLLSVPSAVFGCFLVQYARGLQNDVYMQIGLITLIGLAAKNAILIVEYAKMNMEQGMDVVHAAVEAAHVRLRPILMTSFAFILGCLPLAIATGPGAGARVSMGNAVVGGMTIATLFGIFLIPVLFVVVERFFSRKKKGTAEDNVTEQL